MKRCPQCRRDYTDETLNFCLDDGSELLDGPASGGEPATAILGAYGVPPSGGSSNDPETTKIFEAATATTLPPEGGTLYAPQRTFDKRLLLAPIALAAIVLGGFFGYRYLNAGDNEQINSIAVLPFNNATGDKETEFLADGIAETLINNFTKIPALKVAARSTAFRFRGREGEPIEVGRELKVGSMLTGRLMQRGDQLSVQVDLISTSDGSQLWGNRYEGKTADLVSIQQRIATDVSSQLKLKLTGAQTEQVSKIYTQNAEAYQRYLRGRYHWNRRTSADLKKALEEFQAAAAADPGYAMAFVGLGDTYLLLPEYAGTRFDEAIPKARAFAERALQIDASLGEPHATLGLVNHYLWKWDDADREFEKAIELNPNYPTVHHWYSNNLRERGKYREALAEIQRARELDPLSGIIGINTGVLLMLNGDPTASRQQLQRTIDLDPTWFNGYFWLGGISLIEGRYEEAIPPLQKSVELNPALRPMGVLGFALAKAGRKSEATELLKELERRFTDEDSSAASNIAAIYTGLGDHEKAIEWLEKGYQDHDVEIPRLRWSPQFAPLRDDPRFKELVKRLNLPE